MILIFILTILLKRFTFYIKNLKQVIWHLFVKYNTKHNTVVVV